MTVFKPGSFKPEESTSVDRDTITLADNRAAWFEAIRDPTDPLLTQKTSPKTLLPADYLISAPADLEEKPKTNLDAIRKHIEEKMAQQAREIAQKAKEATFLKGLLGE